MHFLSHTCFHRHWQIDLFSEDVMHQCHFWTWRQTPESHSWPRPSHWENFIEDLNLESYTSNFRTDVDVVYCKNCEKAHDGGSSNERQQSHRLLSYSPTSSSSASHHLQSSVTLPPTYSSGYRCNIQEEGGRSECGKLAKNYPMPISPLLWPEWRPHWARPKVPTTTIEKRHNSNNIATA